MSMQCLHRALLAARVLWYLAVFGLFHVHIYAVTMYAIIISSIKTPARSSQLYGRWDMTDENSNSAGTSECLLEYIFFADVQMCIKTLD